MSSTRKDTQSRWTVFKVTSEEVPVPGRHRRGDRDLSHSVLPFWVGLRQVLLPLVSPVGDREGYWCLVSLSLMVFKMIVFIL